MYKIGLTSTLTRTKILLIRLHVYLVERKSYLYLSYQNRSVMSNRESANLRIVSVLSLSARFVEVTCAFVIMQVFLLGALAKLSATVATYPLLVVKVHMIC